MTEEYNMYAGFPVQVRQTPDRGRIIVATHDLGAGDIVLRSMAYLTTVCDEFKTTVCSTCWRNHPHKLPFHCADCKEVFFCSEQCRDGVEHLPSECAALKRLHGRDNHFTDDENSEIRMILKAYAKKLAEIASGGKPQFDRILAGLNQSDPTLQHVHLPRFADVSKLVPNAHNYSPETQAVVRKMARYVCKIFPKLDGLPPLDEEEIYNTFFREKCNCFGIWDEQDRCLASAVFPTASFFNHSCIPNCTRFPDENGLVSVRTLYPVPAGTELNIAYVTLGEFNTVQRREQLRYYYTFECGCPRCCDTTDASDEFIRQYYCKREGCSGLIVPVDGGKSTMRHCRACSYREPVDYAATFGRSFHAPHYARVNSADAAATGDKSKAAAAAAVVAEQPAAPAPTVLSSN